MYELTERCYEWCVMVMSCIRPPTPCSHLQITVIFVKKVREGERGSEGREAKGLRSGSRPLWEVFVFTDSNESVELDAKALCNPRRRNA